MLFKVRSTCTIGLGKPLSGLSPKKTLAKISLIKVTINKINNKANYKLAESANILRWQ